MSRIRITGGSHRSRLIQVVEAQGLRPTPDRVRETLFNWLGQELSGLVCLDLFAGSGILGFEAASRGAARVDLVEQDRAALAQLRRHARQLDLPQVQVFAGDALKFVASTQNRYDLVFLDPPYGKGLLEKLAPALLPRLAPGARVYAEAERALDAWSGWRVARRGQAGQVFFHLLEQA